MEILKLKPAIKEYLWGGRRLIEEYNKESDSEKVAETWEMSNHQDGSSTIVNGMYSGKTFAQYLENEGKKVWGKRAEKYDKFPVMIKFIDAKQDLSIQVHPDDEYALKNEGEFGKNEFWYVLDAVPGSFLYYGVKEEMSREQFRKRVEDGTICDYLKKVKVKKGDCFYIKTGTIHAIGAGIVVAEIQQCSNSTYRIYDFGRLGANGKLRELHIDKAVDVSNLKPSEKNGEADGKAVDKKGYVSTLLTKNDYFVCTKYDVNEKVELNADNLSFNSVIVLEGNGEIKSDSQKFDIKKGDSYFIPSGFGQYIISGNVSFILTNI